jgi:energy-converting hydrogenase A subunit I
MDQLKIISWFMFIISVGAILYALIFNIPDWMVYGISLIFLPTGILSFGLLAMARGSKEEEEDKRKEPFIGY